jgi:hypothetical protein
MKGFAFLILLFACVATTVSFGYTDTREEKQIILVQDQIEMPIIAVEEGVMLLTYIAVVPGILTIGFEQAGYLEVVPKNTIVRSKDMDRPRNKSPVNDLKKSVTNLSRRL